MSESGSTTNSRASRDGVRGSASARGSMDACCADPPMKYGKSSLTSFPLPVGIELLQRRHKGWTKRITVLFVGNYRNSGDLEDLGHDLGVLKRYEVLDDGEGGER